ncbi:MAG: putative peptide maturation dehydrogenase [Dokdonella sp.]|uniref:putative peptide maturation dehydrogenase n=1 Tax=Dokdonella sp. TaxID=2291710 RepID=UPI0025C5E5D6|nr:putative peptide maturation dehydrogenase [Dokdonella sp.]MBZ0221918.1 putative peptide maturation dehydrogenase [Dokdonella sp.]MCC7255109.1 putative peptide maturation dehydrogenase [Dokdonella sp.]
MFVRRCAILMLEPRERAVFDIALLVGGESGLRMQVEWVALAPHLDHECELDEAQIRVLGQISPSTWLELDELAARHPREQLDSLLDKNLLIAQGSAGDAADQGVRATHWRPAAAVMHAASRWQGVDSRQLAREFAAHSEQPILNFLGTPPAPVREYLPVAEQQRLPVPPSTPFDDLLMRRVTCRNYDVTRPLDFEAFAAVLHRSFAARAVVETAPGVHILKKGVPSAGGLHPTEAYLLVQRVEGLACGLYHYHPVNHALEPLRLFDADTAAALARNFVAGQDYFAQAHVLVIAASRFERNFWKYRNHAKAYRALTLDVGYLSHTIYLASTELGLAAFITAAINEIDIEQALGLDPRAEGPLAVCGFGLRAQQRHEIEFDPLGAVWAGAAV